MSFSRKLASVVDDREALAGFSRVHVSMVLTDPRAADNPIVYVNSAFERTTGYERSAVIGRNCRFLQGEETDKADVDRLRQAVEDGTDVTVDITNYRADGASFTNRLIIAPIFDVDGQIMYFLGIQKDLQDSERERQELDDLLVTVKARVADDLSMVLEGIGAEEGTDPFALASMTRRLEVLQLVYESMKLSDELANDGPGEQDHGIDLGSLLSRIAAAIAHEDGKPGIRYIQEIEAKDVNLGSAIRLSLLVSEVLSNAFGHAFERMEEGFIELRMARLAAGGVRIVVTDDGVGLPPNAPFPDPGTTGGRLMQTMTDGLDATLTAVRGAAGTVVMVDVPAGITET